MLENASIGVSPLREAEPSTTLITRILEKCQTISAPKRRHRLAAVNDMAFMGTGWPIFEVCK